MDMKTPTWREEASGVRVLKLYETDLNPEWPRIVILDLTAERFREFERDPLGFDKTYKLYPEQPILWISHCAQPPFVPGEPPAAESSRWTVVIIHRLTSRAACAACPQTVEAISKLV
jgi:hypothetical protein